MLLLRSRFWKHGRQPSARHRRSGPSKQRLHSTSSPHRQQSSAAEGRSEPWNSHATSARSSSGFFDSAPSAHHTGAPLPMTCQATVAWRASAPSVLGRTRVLPCFQKRRSASLQRNGRHPRTKNHACVLKILRMTAIEGCVSRCSLTDGANAG
jgi:hypothetical protein